MGGRQAARRERFPQQLQGSTDLALVHPQTGQPQQGIASQPQVDRRAEGLLRPFRLALRRRLLPFQAPELGLARLQIELGVATQGLLPHPQGITEAAFRHKLAKLAPRSRLLTLAAGAGRRRPRGHGKEGAVSPLNPCRGPEAKGSGQSASSWIRVWWRK